MAAVQTAAEAKGGREGRGKSALLTTILIFLVFSFGNRAKNGGWSPAFTLDNYTRLLGDTQRMEPFFTSLWMAFAGTAGCLLVGLPLAYFIATRANRHKGL